MIVLELDDETADCGVVIAGGRIELSAEAARRLALQLVGLGRPVVDRAGFENETPY